MTDNKIYTITCLSYRDERTDTRCWGWYLNFEDAKAAVLANATDMFELQYYEYAVIEEVSEGVIAHSTKEWWFFADYEKVDRTQGIPDPVVSEISKPEQWEDIVGFGIG